jgi:vacuolar iron transporter family protein
MMRFELDLSPPPSERLYISALTIGTSYFLGGLLPLIPYFFASTTIDGLIWSCVFTGVILVVFGIVKSFVVNNHTGRKEGWRKALKSGIWTFIVGGLAAGGAFIVVRLLDVKQ